MILSFSQRLENYKHKIGKPPVFQVEGKLVRMVGLTLEAVGCNVVVGSRCLVETHYNNFIEAEVVGFAGEKIYLMPTGSTQGLAPGAKIVVKSHAAEVNVGMKMLGRIIDGAGEPLDGLGPIETDSLVSLHGQPINPLNRHPIEQPLDVGVQAINSLLTVGRGQRMGLFAGSGVGKSVLLSMMARFTNADITVVGLIGERGREVKEFIEQNLGKNGLQRSVVVAAPADAPPLMRLHGAMRALSIAEYFRDQGKQVLLLMDSLTRFAQAQREIALAIGEPPATKGYPPSVFAQLPKLVERAGNAATGKGSITAFFTVLTEGDDLQDPIADSARAILDGHVVLSRALADSGHFPAIDLDGSISRVMQTIVKQDILQVTRKFKHYYSTYQQNRDLINVGAYQGGSNKDIDIAINIMPSLLQFLKQDMNQSISLDISQQALIKLLAKV